MEIKEQLESAWLKIEGDALFALTRLVTYTARFHIEGLAQATKAQADGHPLLWTMWHGEVWPFLVWADRFIGGAKFRAVRVGGDERADILGQLGERLGATTYPADMNNPMAASRAVLKTVRELKKPGMHSFIAPDGPSGPVYEPKGGVAFLARRAKAAVLPMGLWTKHAYFMKRWDNYMVPFPFAQIHVHIGKPILATRKTDEAELLVQISEALHAARTRAQIMAGVAPWR